MNEKLKKVLNLLLLSEDKVVTENEVNLSEVVLDNGTVLVSDEFKEGNSVFIKALTEEDSNLALPVGEYSLEDGKVLVVEIEGEIASISEPSESSEEESTEEIAGEEEEEELSNENEEEMEETTTEEVVEEEEVKEEDLDAKMSKLEARIASLEELLAPAVEMEAEVVEEAKEEVEVALSQETVDVVEEVKFSPETVTKKSKGLYFPKNPMNTTRDRVFSRINKK